LILVNLNSVLDILGRNSTLTGRIPMWKYLYRNVISKRFLFGYGYDAIWNMQGLREQMTLYMNFTRQVTQSDNGFVEIWLHLGTVGLVLLVGLMLAGFVRSVKYLLKERTLSSALPFVILMFAFLANCTVSMLMESDIFVWAVVVASQVAISTPLIQKTN